MRQLLYNIFCKSERNQNIKSGLVYAYRTLLHASQAGYRQTTVYSLLLFILQQVNRNVVKKHQLNSQQHYVLYYNMLNRVP